MKQFDNKNKRLKWVNASYLETTLENKPIIEKPLPVVYITQNKEYPKPENNNTPTFYYF